MKKNYLTSKIISAFLVFAFPAIVNAQCLSCGTGADGAYHATSNSTLAGGTYNYSSFIIDAGDTVNITGTSPLLIYCTGAITINGVLNASGGNGTNGVTSLTNGIAGIGVAGGQNGGDGAYSSNTGPLNGNPGNGNGMGGSGMAWSGGGGAGYSAVGDSSGNPAGGYGGPIYSDSTLNPLLAGSGGGGGSGGYACGGGGGGAGGGIIQLQSCVSITIGATGSIASNGGNGGSDDDGNCGGGGGGSGGTIWLLTNGTITNNGAVYANPGTGGASMVPGNPYYGTGANGKSGRIRFDYNTLVGSGTSSPAIGYTALPLTSSVMQQNNPTCFGNCNGAGTVNATGGYPPYTWLWAPTGCTTMSCVGLCAGSYTVSVTDSTGCVTTSTFTLTQPTALSVSVSGTDASTSTSNDGTATAIGSGGSGPYTYTWMPGSHIGSTITGLAPGTYTCCISDMNGCVTCDSVGIGDISGVTQNDASQLLVSFYPNPAADFVKLSVNMKEKGDVNVEVYNLVGERVDAISLGNASAVTYTYNTSKLENGIYFFRISSGTLTSTKKITVAH